MEKIGVIGGSGLYKLDGIKTIKEVAVKTPYGDPSDKFIIAELNGREIVFLPRHGRNHSINPSLVNYRANIYAMKKLGVGQIFSISACGSLQAKMKPLDFVVADQFIDRTNSGRANTFFDCGVVAHVALAEPVCPCMAKTLVNAAKKSKVKVHDGGTYINMEGPQFSTKAESNLYRQWGADIIGMTNFSEARLAREAEICYATMAAITDYDCWHPEHDSVTIEMIIGNLHKNVDNAKRVLREALLSAPKERTCSCKDALKFAIVTQPQFIPAETKKKLAPITGKYFK